MTSRSVGDRRDQSGVCPDGRRSSATLPELPPGHTPLQPTHPLATAASLPRLPCTSPVPTPGVHRSTPLLNSSRVLESECRTSRSYAEPPRPRPTHALTGSPSAGRAPQKSAVPSRAPHGTRSRPRARCPFRTGPCSMGRTRGRRARFSSSQCGPCSRVAFGATAQPVSALFRQKAIGLSVPKGRERSLEKTRRWRCVSSMGVVMLCASR